MKTSSVFSALAVGAASLLAPMATLADFTVGFADICTASGGPSVPSAYINAFSAQGATTRVLAWTDDAPAITNMVNGIDLLVLCGGEDVDPARYGETRKSYCGASNLTRDAFEWEVLGAAVALGKPVFGV
ncbi:MAG: gamma-glutamyl-gamma-aminobutyrate hydrolase family protein [Kiritimatiellae bacterium]|nr:gamma-glutamyl-gamma-aminobutyrate hydrolase family protein [Kiritimatiellia bacterium]